VSTAVRVDHQDKTFAIPTEDVFPKNRKPHQGTLSPRAMNSIKYPFKGTKDWLFFPLIT